MKVAIFFCALFASGICSVLPESPAMTNEEPIVVVEESIEPVISETRDAMEPVEAVETVETFESAEVIEAVEEEPKMTAEDTEGQLKSIEEIEIIPEERILFGNLAQITALRTDLNALTARVTALEARLPAPAAG